MSYFILCLLGRKGRRAATRRMDTGGVAWKRWIEGWIDTPVPLCLSRFVCLQRGILQGGLFTLPLFFFLVLVPLSFSFFFYFLVQLSRLAVD